MLLPDSIRALRNGRHFKLATSLITSIGLPLNCILIIMGSVDETNLKLIYCNDDMFSDSPDNDFN